MRILVTGSKGFLGKNLVFSLKNRGYNDILEFDHTMGLDLLKEYCQTCDFVFHMAGVNRPKEVSEYEVGNAMFTQQLTDFLSEGSRCPVVYPSSTQAVLDNPYGRSKHEAEQILWDYEKRADTRVYIYRLTNVFGKWGRPNYNSVIATFCYNLSRELAIHVNDRGTLMHLAYIDDVVDTFIGNIEGKGEKDGKFYTVTPIYTEKLGNIADMLSGFTKCENDLSIPNQADLFIKKLYSTYLSYMPLDKIKYSLDMHCDARGSFTEFIRTNDKGQVSVNIAKPGIVKGNHWHHTKHEKFLVVSGKGVIRFRKPDSDEVYEVYVSGDKLEPVIIPPGYSHNIENIGDTDMVTVMWANEAFDPEHPDTIYLEV